jgi:hypothetical protein|nr:MAG TPA: protein of unknown function (DUF5406) [Caudoviricetes sp.]
METYSPNDGENLHEIKYTLQRGKYKGWFTTEIGGNCRGSILLDPDIFDTLNNSDITSSNCNLEVDEYNECFSCNLHDDDGNGLFFDCCDESDMKEMLVAIEIIDVNYREAVSNS